MGVGGIPLYAGDMRASRGKRQICELLRKQNGGHFCEKVALFSVDTTFEKKFFLITSGLDTPVRSSPLYAHMNGASFWSRALCRYDEPFGHNLIFKSHFRIFFRPPLQTWRRGDTFRKWLVIGISTVDAGNMATHYSAIKFWWPLPETFLIPLCVEKYQFWGENHFFSPPCVTPLGSVCKFWSCTRPGLPGKKNRKSIGQ